MHKRNMAVYLALFTTLVLCGLYNVRQRGWSLAVCGSSDGNTAVLPDAITAPPSPAQRWKERVATLGNCSLRPVVPTWDQYFDIVEKQRKCDKMKMFGGQGGKGDGAKNVCQDSAMTLRRDACNVISFGINNEWSFDDAMAALGCKVYSFDPTMGLPDHQRGPWVQFHSLGLSDHTGTIPFHNTTVPVNSYRGVLEHIGLINQTIDYLKIDIEGSEVPFFENVLHEDLELLQHVKQMGVEIHVWNQDLQTRDKFWKIYNRLECLGFRKVYSEKNRYPPTAYDHNKTRHVSCCYELVWINEAFL